MMRYISPECSVITIAEVVHTSLEIETTKPSGSGGIQLPFIPG